MTYMLLIIEPVGQRAERTEAQGREAYARMQRFGEGLRAQGRLGGSASLAGQGEAVRVSQAPGAQRRLDGPFTEAKEMLGGYFLLEGVDREQAIAIASECPAAEWATVEVRALAPCYDESRA